MRILLTSNAPHHPPRGGSTRSNLVWLESLAARGHSCLVVCPAHEGDGEKSAKPRNGIAILSVKDLIRRRGILTREISSARPDFVLVSSEDLSHLLLREACEAAGDRLIYLAHTPQFYPFGPASWNPDPQAAEIVRNALAIVAIGHHMQRYIREHLGRDAAVIHPPIYGSAPFARFGSFEDGEILMINPCVVKGIGIFLELAAAFPGIRFAALTGWGTTSEDLRALANCPNVTVLESVGNIEEALSRARVLLMPSLWYEGFGLIAMEAMLRGIPVISSNSGGLEEAKQGTGFVIPVRPIEHYERVFDENHMPKPVDVRQDIEPWKQALSTLLGDREIYRTEAEISRQAALRFVSGLGASRFEDMLLELRTAAPPAAAESRRSNSSRLENLSPARRALLVQRLRKRSSKYGHE